MKRSLFLLFASVATIGFVMGKFGPNKAGCKSDQDCVSTNDQLTRACMSGFCVLVHGGDIPNFDPTLPPHLLEDQAQEVRRFIIYNFLEINQTRAVKMQTR